MRKLIVKKLVITMIMVAWACAMYIIDGPAWLMFLGIVLMVIWWHMYERRLRES